MKPDSDRLEVISLPGVEPEEAPARRVSSILSGVNLAPELPEVELRGGRPALNFPGAYPVGQLSIPVTSEFTAGEVANYVRRRCLHCKHFRNEEWRKTKKIWESSPPGSERRRGIHAMVLNFARSSLDRPPGPTDLLFASYLMDMWGACVALSEERVDLVVVHPDACCPDKIDYFQPRGESAKQEASEKYDQIMRMAQGRK